MNDDIEIETVYGSQTVAWIMGWPCHTCPTCTRQHAHPPAVTATYWPTCFACWEKSTVRSQEENQS